MSNRAPRHTVSVDAGVALALAATAAGGALLAAGLRLASIAAALLAGAIWITTFEPLVKIAVG